MDRLLTLFFFLETKGLLDIYIENVISPNNARYIYGAFHWRETKQGYDFWYNLDTEFDEWCEVGE